MTASSTSVAAGCRHPGHRPAGDRGLAVGLDPSPALLAVARELARVLRAGGRLGIFDLDSDMTTFTHPDRELTRRIVTAASDATAVDGWFARRLPSLFEQAGLTDVRVRGFFPLETDPRGFYAGLAERSAEWP